MVQTSTGWLGATAPGGSRLRRAPWVVLVVAMGCGRGTVAPTPTDAGTRVDAGAPPRVAVVPDAGHDAGPPAATVYPDLRGDWATEFNDPTGTLPVRITFRQNRDGDNEGPVFSAAGCRAAPGRCAVGTTETIGSTERATLIAVFQPDGRLIGMETIGTRALNFAFTPSPDARDFTGYWSATADVTPTADNHTGTWIGHRAEAQAPAAPTTAPTVPITGRWTSMFGGSTGGGNAPVTLTLTQVGHLVTGAYVPVRGGPRTPPGRVNGTMDGSVVTGTWVDVTNAAGTFRFVFTPDGQGFTGTWASASLSGAWDGAREAAHTGHHHRRQDTDEDEGGY